VEPEAERCERCGGVVALDARTVVLTSDVRGDLSEHVYCGSPCAMAPGAEAAVTLHAIERLGSEDPPGSADR
jgi:hypothetical protein